ncbi:MAG: NAD(P)H-hydrate dehydratase [Lachnospiraceae bacterium]|nr:NAD(P)H-hydrate dehydratase [Lachnospiraceae bacterium]
MKYIVSADEMRKLEQNAIRRIGIPEEVLMERAAYAVWQELLKEAGPEDSVLFLCGTGNNGGDGLAAARMAYLGGLRVSVAIVSKDSVRVFSLKNEDESSEVGRSPEESSDTEHSDFSRTESRKRRTDGNSVSDGEISPTQATEGEPLPPRCSAGFAGQFAILSKLCEFVGKDWNPGEYTIVVDAVFGIGLSRPIAGTYGECIRKIRRERQNGKLRVISVDVPSGIHADTGAVMGIALEADKTVTFGWEKPGLLLYPGAGCAGKTVTADIGIPPEASVLGAGTVRHLEMSDILALPKRNPDTHKGNYGKVAIIAGSGGMCGAALLAAKAAYRAGAGIVTVISAEENRIPIQTALPEAIFAPRSRAEEMIARADCLAIGPGLGTDAEAEKLVALALSSGKPAVADADALNCISHSRAARDTDLYGLLHERVIVTPHVVEMARLTGLSSAEVRENPLKTAREFAAGYGCVCVLKGARTVISDGGKRTFLNTSGNAGMAVGGSGDVLTGIIAGLLGAEPDVCGAAALGVYIHGLAGDRAAERLGERSMTSADILDGISAAFTGR